MEGKIFLDQRDFLRLTEPLHQQRHGGDKIAVIQQSIDDQGVGLGSLEILHVTAPKSDVPGRGAGFVLRENPATFRVFLRAPESVRTHTLMERFGLTEADAARKMHETDSNRAAYIHQVYKHDWCDPDEYDLIVNTGRIGYQATAEIILRGAAERAPSSTSVA